MEWFDSGVGSNVSFQIKGIVETFSAARAMVFFIGCMRLKMAVQKAWV